jgi:glycerol-3-phosphate dehydrogenase
MAPDISQISRIGIVGAGSMGTMMSLGFCEKGVDVSLWDISEQNVDQAREMAEQTDAQGQDRPFQGHLRIPKEPGGAAAQDPHLLHHPRLARRFGAGQDQG